MLEIGQKAPEFTVQNQNEEDVTLSQFKGKKVVIYFYPKDNTPGCTIESKDFSQLKPQFKAANAVILGVSKDSVRSHQNFCHKQDLTIDLLSDPDGTMMEAYDVWKEKSMYGKTFMGVIRSTFLIDQDGVIQQIWSKVKVKNHAKDVLDALKEL